MRIRSVATAAALVALVAAGCGDDGTTSTGGSALPVGTAPTTPATPTGAPTPTPTAIDDPSIGPSSASPAPEASPVSTRCHTSELAASFRTGDAAAGSRYAQLVLTNRAGRTCTVYGYGGLQPLDAARKELPIRLIRDTQQGPPKLVRLAPGATVARTVHWTVVPSGGAKTCPIPVHVSIIPPDETDPLVVAWPFAAVCGGTIDGYPFGVTL